MNTYNNIKVLLVEDEAAHVEMICRHLEHAGNMSIQLTSTLEACFKAIDDEAPDIILIDLHLPDGNAIDLLSIVKGQIPVITLTSRGSEEQAVEVLKAGALDYLNKSSDTFAAMPRIVDRALREWRLQCENERAHETILNQKALKEALLQNTATPIFVLDPHHRVLLWNRACEELTGVKAQEVVGTTRHWSGFYDHERPCLVDVVLDGNSPVALYPEHSLSRLQEEILQAEGWRTGADGKLVYLTFNAAIVRDESGNIIAAIETLQDITSRKKAEDDLRASKEHLLFQHVKLEQANQHLKQAHAIQLHSEKMASIGQLAAGVAHEINNPIGFVSSNLRSLEKYLDKLREFISFQDLELSDQQYQELRNKLADHRKLLKIDIILADIKDLLTESRDGAERVAKIVQDLKGFSRLDQAEYKPVDIVECLESSINIVWNEIKYKATLSRDFIDLPPIPCYPGQLNQVFVNLLVNAAQAIADQGTIDLKAWSVVDHVYIRISDSGCGISPANCDRIFDPFFTTKEVGKGTGLGLSISYDIIKKHQGEISVESTAGKGTSFTIKLPIQPMNQNNSILPVRA